MTNNRTRGNLTPDAEALLRDGFRQLTLRLEEAHQKFVEGNDDGLEGANWALCGVIEFLDGLGFEDRTIPLHKLNVALSDAAVGIHSPILQIKTRAGRKGDTTIRSALRGMAAATVDQLLRTGLKLDESEKLVAKALRDEGVCKRGGGGGRITSTTIHNWRARVRSGAKDEEDTRVYNRYLALKWAEEYPDLVEKRRQLIKRLRHVIGSYRMSDEKLT